MPNDRVGWCAAGCLGPETGPLRLAAAGASRGAPAAPSGGAWRQTRAAGKPPSDVEDCRHGLWRTARLSGHDRAKVLKDRHREETMMDDAGQTFTHRTVPAKTLH